MRNKYFLFVVSFFIIANTFSQDLLIPYKDATGKYGYKSEEGAIVISPRYVNASYWKDDFYRVTEVGEIVDHSAFGIKVIVTENAKWGYLDDKGKTAIPLQFARAFDFKNGVACVSLDGKNYGLIDSKGKKLTAFKYTMPIAEAASDVTWDFKNGPALISVGEDKNRLYGFIDKQGNEIVAPKYSNALKFEEGMAAVKLNEKWGFVDATGKLVIDYQFDDNVTSMLYSFKEGQAHVKKGGKYVFIDTTGKVVGESFKSRVYSVIKAGADNFYNGYGMLLKEDATTKIKYYKPNITLNGQVESLALLDKKTSYNTAYDQLQNPRIAEYKATILKVMKELASGYGDKSAAMYGENYVLRELDDKGAKVYVLNEKSKGTVIAVLMEKSNGLEFMVAGR